MPTSNIQKLNRPAAGGPAHSRCVNKPGSYMVLPLANRVEHYLPGFNGVAAQVLAAPPLGARFVEHELLIQPSGGTTGVHVEDFEKFFYLLEGRIELDLGAKKPHKLSAGSFCWLPPQTPYQFKNITGELSRVVWIRRRYEAVEGLAVPAALVAHQSDVPALPTDTYMEQHLTPYEQPGFDLGINLQTFDPGVYFSMVEAHVMEHGLYMLSGRGIYWLNHDNIEVEKDDFIYMAPFCPQFYYALGWEKSAYLLYKDVNRDYTDNL